MWIHRERSVKEEYQFWRRVSQSTCNFDVGRAMSCGAKILDSLQIALVHAVTCYRIILYNVEMRLDQPHGPWYDTHDVKRYADAFAMLSHPLRRVTDYALASSSFSSGLSIGFRPLALLLSFMSSHFCSSSTSTSSFDLKPLPNHLRIPER